MRATLPPDWERVLTDIESRLAAALRGLDEAGAATAPADDADRQAQWQSLGARLDGLSGQTAACESVVRQTDLALEEAELALQAQVAATAALRLKLAGWTGRAIG